MIDSKEYKTKIKQEKPAAMSAFLFIQNYGYNRQKWLVRYNVNH